MKDAMIVTTNHKYYPMTKHEANVWLVEHKVDRFHCEDAKGIKFFYIEK